MPLAGISFTHACPAGVAPEEYERVLSAPVRFETEFNEGRFASALLDAPLPNADVSLFPIVAEVASRRLAALRMASGAPMAIEQIRRHIGVQIAKGRIALPDVAAAAGLPPRTLQRRLATKNVSFSELLDDVRRDLARQYLLDPSISLTEVGFLLGYSEQSTFNHAFRKWFGVSPTVWRRSRLPTDKPCRDRT